MKKKPRCSEKKKGAATAVTVRMDVVQPRIHLLRDIKRCLVTISRNSIAWNRLSRATVKRNSERFPEDFMFQNHREGRVKT